MTVTNKYSSTYNDIDFVVNERRNDSYDEGSNGQTFSMTYELQAETGIDLDTARAMAVKFISAESLFTREGNPVSRFSIEHENEEDLDRQWVFSLEWSASSSNGDNPTITPWPQIPYTENESWSTEGGTAHVTECVWGSDGQGGYLAGETVKQVDANDPGPSTFNGKIGFNGETSEGVDVVRPTFQFTLQKKVSDADLNTIGGDGYSYKQRLVLLTGTVNNAVFKGWSAGCVLFEGCSSTAAAEYHEEDAIEDGAGGYVIPPRVIHTITFKFKCNLTREALPVCGTTVRKEGFQYMWVYSRKLDDSVTGVTLEYPQTIVVNDVYEKTNFALLGLG
jgi:hypothetical protein